ncbi:MAG: MAF flag10 domain containing protein, partial [Candidatus Nitrosopelagicus sp.]|nr:MAF flag10 domain containing protein [Candidatus Nitrosopelagicus sp.]
MTIRGWKTRYHEIRDVFGYKESDDIASAKKLDSIIKKKFPLSNLKKGIFGKTVFVIGAGPSLDSTIT